jgi:hypothetical protein
VKLFDCEFGAAPFLLRRSVKKMRNDTPQDGIE